MFVTRAGNGDDHLTVCENCQYEVRDGRKHVGEGDGICRIVEADTEKVIGWSKRKYRDIYKKP